MKYLVKLSNNTTIQIDEDELDNVLKAIRSKQLVKVRQGIFNPAYFLALVDDKQRVEEYHNNFYFHNRVIDGQITSGYEKPIGNLPDIFESTKKIG